MRFLSDRLVALLLVLVLLGAASAARAASFNEALTRFAADDYDETEAGIGEVAASGNPMAANVLDALQDGRLLYGADKRIFIKDPSDRLLDAASGRPVAGEAPPDLETVRINNRLRRTIDAAIGALTLLDRDPGRRFDAAQAVFKSQEASARPALEAAIAKETNPKVRKAMLEARAAIVLGASDSPDADKIAAVSAMRERGDQDAVALLASLPSDTSPAVARAARAAVASIQSGLALWNTLQNAWYGLSLGSVLLLAAIGLAITFGVMGVINMAHGEMVMLGAYVTFMVQEVIRTRNPALFDYSLVIALPLAFLVSGFVGVLIERGIIRFLYGRPLETLLATWGLSLILQQAVRTTFGPNNREVGNPSWMSGAFEVGQITITYNRLWIICFALAVFVALIALLRLTRLGLEMGPSRRTGRWRPPWGSPPDASTRSPSGSVPGSRGLPAWRSRRSTMSAPISARATSSTVSWWWCSAAWAICGVRWSARSRSASPTSSSSPSPAPCSARSRSWC